MLEFNMFLFRLFSNRGILSYHLAFVIQFALAYMSAVTHMDLAGGFISRKRSRYCLIVGSALSASLL